MDRKNLFGVTLQIYALFQHQDSKIPFYKHGITDVSIQPDPV